MRHKIGVFLTICGLALTIPRASAVDGIVLIDQNRALAGNVSPGDLAGFPISITQPGAYRLSGNLTAPPNVTAIVISADSVTIDLNGFNIRISAEAPNSVAAIADGNVAHHDIVVRNGSITGTGSGIGPPPFLYSMNGLNFLSSDRLTVEDLRINLPSAQVYPSFGYILGAFSIVRRNILTGGGPNNVCPSLLEGNINTAGSFGGSGSGCVRVNNIGGFTTF